MGTAPRKRSESDVYHVIARGVGKQIIFENDCDRGRYLSELFGVARDLNVEIWAWCLMSNHVHFIAKAPIEVISQLMRQVQSSYATYFNTRHDRTGKLFQGRFASVPVENDEQLATVVRYIHLNPVKAGEPIESPWSSFKMLATGGDGNSGSRIVLDAFGGVLHFRRSHADQANVISVKLPRPRLSENEAIELARETIAPLSLYDLKALPKNERNAKISELREAGLSIRQIVRCTGISQGIVARAGT